MSSDSPSLHKKSGCDIAIIDKYGSFTNEVGLFALVLAIGLPS